MMEVEDMTERAILHIALAEDALARFKQVALYVVTEGSDDEIARLGLAERLVEVRKALDRAEALLFDNKVEA